MKTFFKIWTPTFLVSLTIYLIFLEYSAFYEYIVITLLILAVSLFLCIPAALADDLFKDSKIKK